MPAFKIYFKILYKLKTSILIYAVLFIGLFYILTVSEDIGTDAFEVSKVKAMIINEDGDSTFVDGFIDYLTNYITVVEPGKDEAAIKDALFFGEIRYVLTIPKGFSEDFLKEGTVKLEKQTVQNSTESMSIDTAIDNYLNLARVYLSHIPSISPEELKLSLEKNLTKEASTVMEVQTKSITAYANEFNVAYFNFLGYIIIAASIMIISMIMFYFNGLDIRRRHNASPVSYRRFNLQLILANVGYILSYLLIFIVAGFLMNKSHEINGNLLLIWLNAVVFALTVLSASYLIGIMVNSRKAIAAISTAISVGVSFISGIYVPQQYLGSNVLKAASITPAYWYVRANNSLGAITSFEWNKISEALGCMAIQIGFMIAFISIALVVSKRKRQQSY